MGSQDLVRFEWDVNKDRANRRKHGGGFNAAEQVFDDPLAITIRDQVVDGEERWRTVGVDLEQILLVVIDVDRNRGRSRRDQNHPCQKGEQP